MGQTAKQGTRLSDFLQESVYPRLSPEKIYTWSGHKWHKAPDKWRGACPWHESKSGTSFTVTPSSLLWYCAGCTIGGGPVEYLWRLSGHHGSPTGDDFVRIVIDLAQLAGVTIPKLSESREQAAAWVARSGALATVYDVCQRELWADAGAPARDYLHRRGLDDDAIKSLEIGLYDFGAVRAALRKAKLPLDSNHGAWDDLQGYIAFPWRDASGHPLTLYGRWPGDPPADKSKTTALPGKGSKRSPLYLDRVLSKGHMTVVLVEGVIDAAVLQSLGATDTAAYVGSTPSEAQLDTLRRRDIVNATICPDPDAGGDNGVISFLRRVDPSVHAYVAPRLPEGKDPDEFVLAYGLDAWNQHIRKATTAIQYRVTRALTAHELDTAMGHDAAMDDLLEIAGGMERAADLEAIIKQAAKPLDLNQAALRSDLKQAQAKAAAQRVVAALQQIKEKTAPTPQKIAPVSLKELLRTYRKWLYLRDAGEILISMATIIANRAPGDPVWVIIVAPPGGGKTECIMPLVALPDVHLASSLTEASLLSGTAQKEVADDATGGLLRQVGEQGIICIKDFSGLLSLNENTRGPVLAALREVYDGAWARAVGTDGGRMLTWKGKCGLIAGATPAIDGFHATMAMLGERFTFYRLTEDKRPERSGRALRNSAQELAMRQELTTAVLGFFAGLPTKYTMPPLSEAQTTWLITLADLVTTARSAVERDMYAKGRPITGIWGAELPTRFVKVLAMLRIALLHMGVPEKGMWRLLRKVAMDSMPQIRRQCIEYLRTVQTPQSTRAVAAGMKRPTMTVGRALEELQVYGIAECSMQTQSNLWSLALTWQEALTLLDRFPISVPETRKGVLPAFSSTSPGDDIEETRDTYVYEFRVHSPDSGNGGGSECFSDGGMEPPDEDLDPEIEYAPGDGASEDAMEPPDADFELEPVYLPGEEPF